MENATKALLIAAAVLVAILIISLGIGVFNMASEQVNNAGDLSEYEIKKFNEKFTQYEGTSKSGSDVNALIDTAFNHNLAQEDTANCVVVSSTGTDKGTDNYVSATNKQTSSPKKVSTGSRYTVTCIYNENSKLITGVKVEAVK